MFGISQGLLLDRALFNIYVVDSLFIRSHKGYSFSVPFLFSNNINCPEKTLKSFLKLLDDNLMQKRSR